MMSIPSVERVSRLWSKRRRVSGAAELPVERSARAGSAADDQPAIDLTDWNAIRADFGITGRLARCSDGLDKPFVYLDHAASTHPPSTVIAAYARFL